MSGRGDGGIRASAGLTCIATQEVPQSLLELDALSDYADMPGYPVASLSPLEAIEQDDPFVSEWERMRQERD